MENGGIPLLKWNAYNYGLLKVAVHATLKVEFIPETSPMWYGKTKNKVSDFLDFFNVVFGAFQNDEIRDLQIEREYQKSVWLRSCLP